MKRFMVQIGSAMSFFLSGFIGACDIDIKSILIFWLFYLGLYLMDLYKNDMSL